MTRQYQALMAYDGVELSYDPEALEAIADRAIELKIGASGLIMAILGGALLTPLQGKISDLFGVNASYLVPLVCFCVVLAYAWYVVHNSVEKLS